MSTGHFLLAMTFLILICSCGGNKTVVIPATVLPEEKMAAVLVDIHIAEAEAHLRTLPDLPTGQAGSTSKEKLSFQKTFDKHSITKQQYEESLSFYIDHPELLDKIYVQVLNELSKMQAGK